MSEEKKPRCKLVGKDGNVFSIIGSVARSLKEAGQKEKAKEFQEKALQCHSYDEVLALLHNYVDPY